MHLNRLRASPPVGSKTVAVSEETWRKLVLLKMMWGCRSIDEVLRRLLATVPLPPAPNEQPSNRAEPPPAPLPYREGGGKAGAGGGSDPAAAGRRRRARSLEELEDCAVIAGVRRPEALRRRCAELGLRLHELDEVGVEGVALVCAEP
jgi:hypothetical protein